MPAQSEPFSNLKEAKTWGTSVESAIREDRIHPHLAGGKKAFAELVRRYRDTVMKGDETGSTRSGATVNRYLSTLSHMLTMAIKEWRLVGINPVRDITKKKEARGRVRFLSDAERDTLLAACLRSDWPTLHTLVLLAISTGARRGELVNLRWEDVDLRGARAIVRETKSGETRSLPLVGKAHEALQMMKVQGSAKGPWVFPRHSALPGPYESFDGVWYDALEAAGIDDFHFHDLRPTMASYLAAQGASRLEIGDIAGAQDLKYG